MRRHRWNHALKGYSCITMTWQCIAQRRDDTSARWLHDDMWWHERIAVIWAHIYSAVSHWVVTFYAAAREHRCAYAYTRELGDRGTLKGPPPRICCTRVVVVAARALFRWWSVTAGSGIALAAYKYSQVVIERWVVCMHVEYQLEREELFDKFEYKLRRERYTQEGALPWTEY